jgi:hypothetical protein
MKAGRPRPAAAESPAFSRERHTLSDICFLRDGHRYVYHYTRAEKLICILRSRELRFRKFADVDDPYEYKNWAFSYRDTGADFDPALD